MDPFSRTAGVIFLEKVHSASTIALPSAKDIDLLLYSVSGNAWSGVSIVARTSAMLGYGSSDPSLIDMNIIKQCAEYILDVVQGKA